MPHNEGLVIVLVVDDMNPYKVHLDWLAGSALRGLASLFNRIKLSGLVPTSLNAHPARPSPSVDVGVLFRHLVAVFAVGFRSSTWNRWVAVFPSLLKDEPADFALTGTGLGFECISRRKLVAPFAMGLDGIRVWFSRICSPERLAPSGFVIPSANLALPVRSTGLGSNHNKRAFDVWMAIDALLFRHSSNRCVCFFGNYLKVFRVYTNLVVAYMVKMLFGGYVPSKQPPSNSVRQPHSAASNAARSVSGKEFGSNPVPASGFFVKYDSVNEVVQNHFRRSSCFHWWFKQIPASTQKVKSAYAEPQSGYQPVCSL